LKELKTLDIVDVKLTSFPEIPSTLCSLSLTGTKILSGPSNIGIIQSTKLPDLVSLSIVSAGCISMDTLVHLMEPSKGRVRHLSLHGWSIIPDLGSFAAFATAGYIAQTEVLTITASHIIDEILELVAANAPNLTELNASHNHMISGISVKALALKKGKKLTKLDLTHCSRVSADATKYARSTGVTVIYRFPDSSKHVRYNGF
jgi:Leucine-rich repeat (LRR) protein